MFNEITLTLHILLLVAIYFFLFVVVRAMARDISTPKQQAAGAEISFEENVPRIMVRRVGTLTSTATYPLYDELLIGRAADCDIVLDDTFISGHHARVYRMGPDYWLEDLESTNGTLVDNIQIDAPVNLRPGNEFVIAQNILRFVN